MKLQGTCALSLREATWKPLWTGLKTRFWKAIGTDRLLSPKPVSQIVHPLRFGSGSTATRIMGIDIYAQWHGQTKEEETAQITGFSTVRGHVGYLRESYHGEPYATKHLCAEIGRAHV